MSYDKTNIINHTVWFWHQELRKLIKGVWKDVVQYVGDNKLQ